MTEPVTEPLPQPARSRRGLFVGLAAALVLVVVAVVVIVLVTGKSPDQQLIQACENTVQQNLKAPSTAKFSGATIADTGGVVGEKTVTGYVDAENGFSAMIRSTFTCDLMPNDSGYDITGSVDEPQDDSGN